MKKEEIKAFWEDEYILNNFITAILLYKIDALNCGHVGLNYGQNTEQFENNADEFLRTYFDNFTDLDYEKLKPKFLELKGKITNTK